MEQTVGMLARALEVSILIRQSSKDELKLTKQMGKEWDVGAQKEHMGYYVLECRKRV